LRGQSSSISLIRIDLAGKREESNRTGVGPKPVYRDAFLVLASRPFWQGARARCCALIRNWPHFYVWDLATWG